MEFKVSELEREPIDFELEAGSGSGRSGRGGRAAGAAGRQPARPRCCTSTAGPKDIVADIRLRGRFAGSFQVPCARCVEPVEIPLAADFDLIFRPAAADAEATERSITAPETEIGYYQEGQSCA